MKIYNISASSRTFRLTDRLSRLTEEEIAYSLKETFDGSLSALASARTWKILEPRPEIKCICGGVYEGGDVIIVGSEYPSYYLFVREGAE